MKDAIAALGILLAMIVTQLIVGCSLTKINYEQDKDGVVSYSLYHNDHWLKTSGTGISGGMTKDGKFEFAAEGLERSPSEEFNRTMQTYTTAFVQLAQIAAAAYNPSASAAAAKASSAAPVTVQVAPASTSQPSQESQPSQSSGTSAADCPDCEVK